MIGVQALTVRLGDFTLDNVSFTVPTGAYGVVIGPAGAGKTTLLESIAGLLPIRAGAVRLGDVDGAVSGLCISTRICFRTSPCGRTSRMARQTPRSPTR